MTAFMKFAGYCAFSAALGIGVTVYLCAVARSDSVKPGASPGFVTSDQQIRVLTHLARQTQSVPPVLTGNTYYVSPTGSDANAGNKAEPFQTIRRALRMLNAGDTLYIRAGAYAESLDNNVPSGASWDRRVAVAAYPGEEVVLRPGPGSQFALKLVGDLHHILIDGLSLDAKNTSDSGIYIDNYRGQIPHHIRIQNCEVKNAAHQGVIVGASHNLSSDHHEFIHITSHHNGKTDHDHGFYISGSHELLDGCEAYANGGEGIQIYRGGGVNGVNASYNTVRNCKLHDNGSGGMSANVGLGIYKGDGNVAYNNLVWHNGIGIAVEIGASNTLVYNNTLYDHFGDAGMRIGYTRPRSVNTVVRNNIIYKNAKNDILDYGTKTIADHNLLNNTDPGFVDATRQDFHLRPGSPAIDQGATLKEVPTDRDGVSRPQGRAYDLGAYER
jgi:hypothetical protein